MWLITDLCLFPERLLAANNPLTQTDRPHQLFADAPPIVPHAPEPATGPPLGMPPVLPPPVVPPPMGLMPSMGMPPNMNGILFLSMYL